MHSTLVCHFPWHPRRPHAPDASPPNHPPDNRAPARLLPERGRVTARNLWLFSASPASPGLGSPVLPVPPVSGFPGSNAYFSASALPTSMPAVAERPAFVPAPKFG